MMIIITTQISFAQVLSEPRELTRARDNFCKQIEQAKTIYQKRLNSIGAAYSRQNKQQAVSAVKKELAALENMSYSGASPSIDEYISVVTRHRNKPLTVDAIRKESEVSDVFIEAGRFDPEWKGKENVLHIHPISQLSPCSVDFSRLTLAGKGTITCWLRGNNDCEVVVKSSGAEVEKRLITGREWTKIKVPYDHTGIVVEGHVGGFEKWNGENLAISYSIEED